jgi:hypothetical protein
MIFVVGARRSGTNWIQRVIAAHPDVVAVPSETFLFSSGLAPLRERFHSGVLSSTISGFVYGDLDELLDRMRDLCDTVFLTLSRGLDPSAQRIVERTPNHVEHLGLIGEIYPDAHVVHIVRDGRDVVRSLLSHGWATDDVREAATEWRNAVTAARSEAPKLEHYYEVRYEQLLSDQTQVRAVFDALGLDTGEAQLRAALAEVGVAYNTDPASPAVAAEKWKNELSEDVLRTIDEVAGDILEDLGYGPSVGGGRRVPQKRAPRRFGLRRPKRSELPPQEQVVQAAYKLDLFLDAVAKDPSRLVELLTPDARVRIVDGSDRFEARGADAIERLIAELQRDAVLRGPQDAGYVHPSTTSATFVGSFVHDGRSHPRVFYVLTPGGGKIERVAYYRFPADARERTET